MPKKRATIVGIFCCVHSFPSPKYSSVLPAEKWVVCHSSRIEWAGHIPKEESWQYAQSKGQWLESVQLSGEPVVAGQSVRQDAGAVEQMQHVRANADAVATVPIHTTEIEKNKTYPPTVNWIVCWNLASALFPCFLRYIQVFSQACFDCRVWARSSGSEIVG